MACSAGATIYEIGGVWNDTFYALGQGKIYKMPVSGLGLTYAQEIPKLNELRVMYKPSAIELVSSDKRIDRCTVYSITGQLMLDAQPLSYSVELPGNSLKPGIYIVKSSAGNMIYTNKIVFR